MTRIKYDNPVLYQHKGIDVRKVNSLRVDVGEMEMIRLINAQEASGWLLSKSQILAMQGRPCQNCGNENSCVPVPKGILSTNKQWAINQPSIADLNKNGE